MKKEQPQPVDEKQPVGVSGYHDCEEAEQALVAAAYAVGDVIVAEHDAGSMRPVEDRIFLIETVCAHPMKDHWLPEYLCHMWTARGWSKRCYCVFPGDVYRAYRRRNSATE